MIKIKETGPNGVEAKVKKYARGKGCLVRKFSSPANRGVPDDVFITPKGQVFFIEFKSPGKKPTHKQEYEINEILKRRGKAFVVDGVDTFGVTLWHMYFEHIIEIHHSGCDLIDEMLEHGM
jgi:hypothetical protein